MNIAFGAVAIPIGDVIRAFCANNLSDSTVSYIILQSRLPQAVTATMAGAGLAVSGLMLQTAFQNPLAGPSVLGISSGANLGVAVVMLITGGSVVSLGAASGFTTGALTIAAALIGSLAVTLLLLAFSRTINNNLILLIAGMMLSYLISSLITLLTYQATASGLQGYIIWGMGDFSLVSLQQMPWLLGIIGLMLICCLPLIKPLNALQLGTQYAENLGFSVPKLRNTLLITTGIITAVITAFCGPISFLGLAVPHIARFITRTDNYRILMPMTIILGAATALLCNLLCNTLSDTVIPLAAITPIVGAPVILYVILSRK